LPFVPIAAPLSTESSTAAGKAWPGELEHEVIVDPDAELIFVEHATSIVAPCLEPSMKTVDEFVVSPLSVLVSIQPDQESSGQW
jgi:hypothetical protein